jgi:hypothetical protein
METQTQPQIIDPTSAAPTAGTVTESTIKNEPPIDYLAMQVSDLEVSKPLKEITYDRSRFSFVSADVPLAGEDSERAVVPKTGFLLRFEHPTFVSTVGLKLEPAGRVSDLRLVDPDGVEHQVIPVEEGRSLVAEVNMWATELTINPSEDWRKRSPDYLSLLVVRGFDLNPAAFKAIEAKIEEWQEDWTTFKSDANKERMAIEEGKRSLRSDQEAHQDRIKQDEQTRQIAIKEHEDKLAAAAAQVSEKRKEFESVLTELTPKQAQLTNLKGEVSTLEAARTAAEAGTLKLKQTSDKLQTEIENRQATVALLTKRPLKLRLNLKNLTPTFLCLPSIWRVTAGKARSKLRSMAVALPSCWGSALR